MWLSISATLNGGLFGSREGQHQPCCFLSSEKQQKARMKNVSFSLFCCESRSDSQTRAVLRLLLWLWLHWPQTSTPLTVFLVYSLVLVFLEILKNCRRVVQRRQPWRAFPSTQLSSVSDDRFKSSMCLCIHICTAAAEENIQTTRSAWMYLQQLLYYQDKLYSVK